MRKGWYILCLLFLSPVMALATSGGELCYKYLGPGRAANTSRYEISLYISANCKSVKRGDNYPAGGIYFVFWNKSNPNDPIVTETIFRADSMVTLTYTPGDQCIGYRENYCFKTECIRTVVELPDLPEDYLVTTSQLYWILDGVKYSYRFDIDNTDAGDFSGTRAVYTTIIPGTKKMGTQHNSSPLYVFPKQEDLVICEGATFTHDFSQKDTDGDVVLYSFCGLEIDGVDDAFPEQPPYHVVPFKGPVYSTDAQMGEGVTLDPKTGILTGIALRTGVYIVQICVTEYRKGVIINQHAKNLTLFIGTCLTAQAALKNEYVKCKDFTFSFQNEFFSTMPISYNWDFGVAGKTNDTSSEEKPTFTYPDTGVYKIKLLIVSKDSLCRDSANAIVRVYPGFKPGFIIRKACTSVPVQFVDTSKTLYGKINSWQWNFDDMYSPVNDTSSLQNPIYKYANRGSYTVSLVAGSTVGCIDTIKTRMELFDVLLMTISPDTLICAKDSLLIYANTLGKITWSPDYAISDIHSFTPKVSPDTNTHYIAYVDAGPGCTATDTVFVQSLNMLQVDAGRNMINLCIGDTAQLNAYSADALTYNWTGNNILSSPDSAVISIQPKQTTSYYITTAMGSCEAKDTVVVNIYNYPDITAYADTTVVCAGKEIQLHVKGNADAYTWTPDQRISDVTAKEPFIAPQVSTAYHVVAHDTTGCTKPVEKLVIVNVIHKIKPNAGNDTAVNAGQLLQLNATGGTQYEWTPSAGLSNASIANPTARLNDDISYTVRVRDDEGCTEYDSLHVRVFRTGYDILVPNAFTPNGDGLNDIFRPEPVGIKEFRSFEVYDRWGQPVFRTTKPGEGWNGRINSIQASPGTYVWMVSGRAVDGVLIQKRGTVVLLR